VKGDLSTGQSSEEDRYCGQNTAGEGITKKNPGAGIQDGEDKVTNLCCVTNNCSAATRVEAGSNTSTVALRIVGGDGKGSLESETVKYGHEFHGTRTRK
jgi:hypothetical protein